MEILKIREISRIYIDGYGWVDTKDGKIEQFNVSGEMGYVDWYRQGDREFNGKYVKVIEYKK